jgi:hypothetical protein
VGVGGGEDQTQVSFSPYIPNRMLLPLGHRALVNTIPELLFHVKYSQVKFLFKNLGHFL